MSSRKAHCSSAASPHVPTATAAGTDPAQVDDHQARRCTESELASQVARGTDTGMPTRDATDSGGELACGQHRCLHDPNGGVDLMTLDEFLDLVGIARSTFHDWTTTGRAPARIKLPNGGIRLRKGEVERWLADLENGDAA